jgi:hypothetical protein
MSVDSSGRRAAQALLQASERVGLAVAAVAAVGVLAGQVLPAWSGPPPTRPRRPPPRPPPSPGRAGGPWTRTSAS